MATLRVEVTTDETGPDEAYHHRVEIDPEDPLKTQFAILRSVATFYAAENVTSIFIVVEDDG